MYLFSISIYARVQQPSFWRLEEWIDACGSLLSFSKASHKSDSRALGAPSALLTCALFH